MPSPAPWLEIIDSQASRGPFRAAIFDFDGTLSLLRHNWQDTMIPMMVRILQEETGTREPAGQLQQRVEAFVMRLNGKQTIFQMLQLCEEIRARGGQPRAPLDYKGEYHDLLWQHVSARIDRLRRGETSAEQLTVPGAHALIESLADRGWRLYLASGTDLNYVREELELLGLAGPFEQRVYGALEDYRKFSKAMIIQQIIDDCQLEGREIVAFGDGFVEIEETRRVGGLAIGVASNEDTRRGINAWKRRRLIQAGAQWIVGDYRQHDDLVSRLVCQVNRPK